MIESLSCVEQDLHAYVDGALSPEARRRVEARLVQNSAAWEQVEAYRRLNRELARLFDPVLAEPIPAPMRQPSRPWPMSRPLRALAASLVLLVSGAGIGWQLNQSALFGDSAGVHLVQDAVMAYSVYAPEVRHPVEVDASEATHLSAWLSKRLAANVRIPHLEESGYGLLGGRLLATADGPGALMMYENAQGQRLVLYLCENDLDGRSTSLRYSRRGEKSVFYWFDGPFSFALVAEMERTRLMTIAESVYQSYEG